MAATYDSLKDLSRQTMKLLFAMSVLPDFSQAERVLRSQMSVLLGTGRTITAA